MSIRTTNVREIELKIRMTAGELAALRHRLQQQDAKPGPREEEVNVLFESADKRLQPAGELLRLRTFAGRDDARLTFKGPVDAASSFKVREELEVAVEDGSTARKLLEALGYRATGEYRKTRERWYLSGVEVSLDQLSSGEYVEIEGNEEAILVAVGRLGLAGRPHIRDGYAKLERQGNPAP